MAKSLSFPCNVKVEYYPIKIKKNKPKKIKELKKPYKFVFVGRLDHFKGADILLKATKLLKNKNFKVLIIGKGNDSYKLKKKARRLGISKKTEFLGKLPNKEALKLVESSIAIVVPSRWNEPAGYVSLEASSVQTCSIISDMGGLPEVGGPSALIFKNENIEKLASHMEYCLENPTEAIKRGNQAMEYVRKKFSPEKAANQLIEVCKEVSGRS
jgi:glycosyltransferase involved in cell wall biosynthesis